MILSTLAELGNHRYINSISEHFLPPRKTPHSCPVPTPHPRHHKRLFLDTERGGNLTCGRAPPLPPAPRAALLSSLWTTSLPSCPPSALLTCVRGRQSSPWHLAAVNIHVQVFV